MKNFAFLLIVIMISFISCDNEPENDSFGFGTEADFKIRNVYHSADNSLSFSITEINDFRCPADVICIWAGKAEVTIKVEKPVAGTIKLGISEIDTVGNYSFKIVNILPYPISTKKTELKDYEVVLKIENLKH